MQINLSKFKGTSVKPYNCYVTELTKENIKEILELHPIVREYLESEDDFYFDEYDYYKHHLVNGGKILGCYVNNKLIAYGVAIFPGYDSENLGYDINLNSEELPFVAHLDSFIVHPNYRGNKLQYKLSLLIEEIARQKGCKHLFSTVSPNNIYSLTNLKNLGLEIKLEKLKYDGKLRYILYKAI